jgi:type IV pilus assembly protein PilY1
VNIFDPSDKHPNGWGTILVVGLSFGGGDYTFDPDGDGFDADTTDDVTTRSSYIILDITDPESAPELVAEISDPNMGYTTSRPTLIKNRRANDSTGSFVNPEVNDWYLVFGSGPYGSDATAKKVALDFAVSDQTGKIFIFDLQSKSFEGPSAATTYFDVAEAATGFIGDISSVDWNNDYADDAVYFGTVRDGVNDAEGDLMRLPLEFGASGLLSPIFSKVLSSSGTDSMARPFTGAPLLSRDAAGNAWIYAGSGRFFTSKDSLSTNQQGYYGVKELIDTDGSITSTVPVPLNGSSGNDLINTTNIIVFDDFSVEGLDSLGVRTGAGPTLENGNVVNFFAQLRSEISNERGWYFEFEQAEARNVGSSASFSVNVLFTEYIPSSNICIPFGETFLNAVNFSTGTSTPVLGLEAFGDDNGAGSPERLRSASLVVGLSRDVVVTQTKSGDATVTGVGTGGDVVSAGVTGLGASQGRLSWREISIE